MADAPTLQHIQGIASDARDTARWADDLRVAVETACADASVNVLIVTIPPAGEGAVAAGAEMEALCDALAGASKPVVLELSGRQHGWGVSFASCADLVVAADDTEFDPALLPVPTAEALWPLYLPVRVAKWLAFGAGPIGAAEALRVGFVNRVVPASKLEEETRRFAERLARLPSDLLIVKKQSHAFATARP